MKKRLISLLLIVSTLLTMVPTQAFATDVVEDTANPFSDVKQSDWFYDDVLYALENGLFAGVSDTKFNPQGTMTRAMFVTVLGRMAEIDPDDYDREATFSDVAQGSWCAPYVEWAAEQGITTGTNDGKFSPNGLVSREQMAAFTVRYFEAYDIPFPEDTITTTPKDYDRIADYAKDAVMKLWACGLFQGDTWGNFNPKEDATRAEAATFCSRTDTVVEQWFVDTGVKEEPTEEETTSTTRPSTGGGGSVTRNYKVTFDLGGETNDESLYPQGTVLSTLVPQQPNGKVFLGWYNDEALETPIDSADTLTRDITLYAKFADATPIDEGGTQNFVSALDQPKTFSIKVPSATSSDFTFRNITDPTKTDNTAGIDQETVKIVDGVISSNSGGFTPGHTYQIALTNDSLIFDETYGDTKTVFDEAKNTNLKFDISKIRIFNFSIQQDGTLNLQLNNDIKYIAVEGNTISAADVAGLMAYQGLYLATTDGNGETVYTANNGTGSFTYADDDIAVGDVVSLYEGTKPTDRKPEKGDGNTNNGDVVYVKITNKNGYNYQYIAAEAEEVIFTPDIIPMDVDDGDGTTGWTANGTTVTVDNTKLVFSGDIYAQGNLTSETVVEKGDYLAFYMDEFDGNGTEVGYGKITDLVRGDLGTTTITYESVTADQVFAAMDLYDETTFTEEEVAAAVEAVKDDARDIVAAQLQGSGFFDDAGLYLAEAALLTEEVRDVFGDDLTMKDVTVTYADGTPVGSEDLELMGNIVGGDDKKVSFSVSPNLDYFDRSTGTLGMRVEVAVNYEFEIQKEGNKNKLVINLQAVFEQELLFGLGVSGGAVWKKWWIIPYIADYRMTGTMDMGTYTGIAVSAMASLTEDEEPWGMPWPSGSADKKATEQIFSMGESIEKAMDEYEKVMPESQGSAAGGLADKYADFMEDANDAWIDLFEVPICSQEGTIDPYGILAYSINVDFVVSANLNVALGFTFHYVNHKRQTFSLMLFSKESTSDTVDLSTNGYQFDFYVMGTIGIRAGIRVKALMGLFSTRIAGIGLQLEVGAYAQLWGYFYYCLSNWKDQDTGQWAKNSAWSGALYIEIGAYVDIKFIAEALNGKYTFAPTLYGDQFPFWNAGERENVYDFGYEEAAPLEITNVTTYTLPSSYYDMAWMDMKTGEVEDDDGNPIVKNFDSNKYNGGNEERFAVEFGNSDVFSYDPTNNCITVTPEQNVFEYDTDLTLTWLGAPLAGSSETIKRTIDVSWSNLENAGTIAFETNGGSPVSMLARTGGHVLGASDIPANPTKQGYTFGGWYSNSGLTTSINLNGYRVVTGNNITVYAKWTPALVNYTVEHYQKGINNRYVLFETETKTGLTESNTAATGKTYTGFKSANPISQVEIQPDGASIVEIYYDRQSYDVTYVFGNGSNNAVVSTIYGGTISQPSTPFMQGYTFKGWDDEIPTTLDEAKPLTFTAQWEVSTDTPYFVEHYKESLYGDFVREYMEAKKGTTGQNTAATPAVYTGFTGPDTVVQKTIAGNGSTTVRIEYTRNSNELTWDVDGGDAITSAANTYTNGDVKYGAKIVAPPVDPTKTGYVFAGWYYLVGNVETAFVAGETNMPDSARELYAKWNPGTATAYTVEHYLQDLTGDGYTLVADDTETKYGTTGEYTNAVAKTTYPGFIRPDPVTQGKIAADGSTVVRIEYTRNSYTLTWELDDGIIGDGDYTVAGETKYGTTIVTPNVTKQGYTLSWYTDATFETPLADDAKVPVGGITIYAKWTAGANSYKVKHYQQNITNNDYTLSETEDKTGATDATTTAVAKFYTGFTAGAVNNVEIAADGNTVVKIYYTRNSYDLDWNFAGVIPTDAPYTTGSVKYETPIVMPTISKTGYSVAWYTNEDCTEELAVTTMPDGKLTIYAKWTAGTVNYTVEHYQQNIADNDYTLFETEPKTGDTDALTAEVAKSYDGFTAGDVTNVAIAADGSTVVEIYYDRNSYALSWNENGGDTLTGDYTPEGKVKFGATITFPNEPTKTGADFDGWYDETTKYEAGATMPADALELTAKWSTGTYTFTFDLNGGDGDAPDAITLAYGATVTAPTAPTREGYTFDGWATTSTGTVVTLPTTMPAGSQTYYAQWTAKTYSLTFDTGDTAIPVTYGAAIGNLPEPTMTGYTFDCWKIGNDTITATTVWNYTDDQRAVAQWNLVTYTISYTLNDGTVTGTANPTSYDVTDNFTLTNPTKTGYNFAGWTGTELEGANETVTVATGSTGDREYTATWTAETYTLTFDTQDTTSITVTYGAAIGNLPEPTMTGYTFTGWQIDGTPITATTVWNYTASQQAVAQWNLATYIITFENDDGATANITQDYGTTVSKPADPTKTGYTFAGWYTNSGLTTAVNWTDLTMPLNGATYYAKWTAKAYTLTLDPNGGTVSPDSNTVTYDKTFYDDLPTPTRVGYTFTGWKIDGTPITASTVWKYTKDKTAVAQWSIGSYNVSFYNGNELHDSDTLAFGDTITPPETNPTRTGYTFDGWSATKGGTTAVDFTNNAITVPAGGVTYYAIWTADTYTITLDYNDDGATENGSIEVAFGGTYSGLPEPTRDNYTFSGWYYNDGGNMVKVESNTTLKTNGDHTLTAQWESNLVTVTFVIDEVESTKEYAPGDQTNNITKDGYYFLGWSTNETGGTPDRTFNVQKGVNLKLYAQWSKQEVIDLNQIGYLTITPTYNGKSHPVTVDTGTYTDLDANSFVVEYKLYRTDIYTTIPPTAAGNYAVRITREEDATYDAFEKTYSYYPMQIAKAERPADTSYTATTEIVGYSSAKVSIDGIDDLHENAEVTYQLRKQGSNLRSDASTVSDADGYVYGLVPGTDYQVSVQITGDPNYVDWTSAPQGTYVTTSARPDSSSKWVDVAVEPSVVNGCYQITSPEELAWIAAAFIQTPTVTTFNSAYTIQLMDDIDLQGKYWTPIGSWSEFGGHFDGGGHTISNMFVDEAAYGGLFGRITYADLDDNYYTSDSTISNVTLQDSYVESDWSAGGLAAQASYTTISNCTVYGTVYVNDENSMSGNKGYLGGIVGYAGHVTMKNCKSYGKVYDANTDSLNSFNYVGGFVGFIHYSSLSGCSTLAYVFSDSKERGGFYGHDNQNNSGLYQSNSNNVWSKSATFS